MRGRFLPRQGPDTGVLLVPGAFSPWDETRIGVRLGGLALPIQKVFVSQSSQGLRPSSPSQPGRGEGGQAGAPLALSVPPSPLCPRGGGGGSFSL